MHIVRYLRGVLSTSNHCSIDIETLWPEKPAGKNDLNKAPLGLTNSNFDQLCGEAILSISLALFGPAMESTKANGRDPVIA